MTNRYFIDCEFLEGTQTERGAFGLPLRTYNKILVGVYLLIAWVILSLNYFYPSYLVLLSPENTWARSVSALGWAFIALAICYAWNLKPSRWINKPTIDLISIGIVAEDGREYYAISKDFNLREAWERYQINEVDMDGVYFQQKEYWIRENVLRPIYAGLYLNNYFSGENDLWNFDYKTMKRLINKYGKTNAEIADGIKQFVGTKETIGNWQEIKDKMNTQFYAYYADYDWVAFCWLFGKMNDLPEGFPMYCIDLKQMFDEKEAKINHNAEVKWDLKKLSHYPKQTNEHNALADARWNQELYKFIQSL